MHRLAACQAPTPPIPRFPPPSDAALLRPWISALCEMSMRDMDFLPVEQDRQARGARPRDKCLLRRLGMRVVESTALQPGAYSLTVKAPTTKESATGSPASSRTRRRSMVSRSYRPTST